MANAKRQPYIQKCVPLRERLGHGETAPHCDVVMICELREILHKRPCRCALTLWRERPLTQWLQQGLEGIDNAITQPALPAIHNFHIVLSGTQCGTQWYSAVLRSTQYVTHWFLIWYSMWNSGKISFGTHWYSMLYSVWSSIWDLV